ncbi:RES family NAD+ phosphorylase [Lujinxingia vulgaris]|nr:RES domain-containing protein [Lujinxingia vulgaris]
MMRAFRLTDQKWAATAFDGEGARRFGGRWNHRGSAVAYTSESLALATLEQLVHVSAGIPLAGRVAIRVDIPDDLPVRTILPDELPEGWRRVDGLRALKTLGSEWILSRESAVLRVPSVIIPSEFNLLLNPSHPDLARLTFHLPEPYAFDPRLLSSPSG